MSSPLMSFVSSLLCPLLYIDSVFGADQFTRNVGSPREFKSLAERMKWFKKLHNGTWPPPRMYPGGIPRQKEPEGWGKLLSQHERVARGTAKQPLSPPDLRIRLGMPQHDPSASVLDRQVARWQSLAQMYLVRNYTASGWHHDKLDPALHSQVYSLWSEHRKSVREGRSSMESEWATKAAHFGPNPEWWSFDALPEKLKGEVILDLRKRIASWAGVQDHATMTCEHYGFRSYLNRSGLYPHVDTMRTHVLSAVYCLEVKQRKKDITTFPWTLGAVSDFSGEPAWVDLRDGELFLYESAKLPHERTGLFVGMRYTAMFFHCRPADFHLEPFDLYYTLPPGWDKAVKEPRYEL